ncbi:MAG TPA: hypothetical protein VE778_05795 [Candidatus Bathyarchaeia archaeon]|jgi:hypothetical protein|nr:hypothetical protein [Candidatus Bathyarchaeia archaeon]
MNVNAPGVRIETVTGLIENFTKKTPAFAVFVCGGVNCKAYNDAAKQLEIRDHTCIWTLEGHYVESRFGREFVAEHGHVTQSNAPGIRTA